ncbi:MAG: hypothetical protein JSV36_12550 [Anaerolineae bacterium]|nr:MAG: hypothetical protein JSV36_12550 [Anaerolineae bacterium]
MGEIGYFIPGESDRATGLLSGYFQPVPATVVSAYIEAYTQPGDLVVDPFCEGPTVLHGAVDAGRRAVGSSFNPLAVTVTRRALTPPTRRQLDAAVTRLGDAPRMELPFREHIESLYAVRCPRCSQATPADAFIWDREATMALRARWQCRHCGHPSARLALGDESARGETIQKQGLHYWYTLDRVAPTGDPQRERTQGLLELYTPRNLYALSSLLMKIESLFADDEAQNILKLVLLRCLDSCSNLYGPLLSPPRQRLRPPAQFLERNVWRAFLAAADVFPTADGEERFPFTDDLDELLTGEGEARVALLSLGVNRLVAALPPDRVALVIATPPRPDPVPWALSWLWTGWLFGHQAAAPLKPLLRQWRVDWDWYARTMQAAFRALRALLADEAPLVLAFEIRDPVMVETLALALAGAGYAPGAWIQQADTQAYRLVAHRVPSMPLLPADVGELADALCAETSFAVRQVLATRGEPLTWDALRMPVYRQLASSGLLGQAAVAEDLSESPRAFVARQVQDAMAGAEGLICLEEAIEAEDEVTAAHPRRWWLAQIEPAAPPLSTRVEAAVHQLLLSTLILTGDALMEEVYRRFPGDLTPEVSLIETCLRSYGQEITPHHWQLRPEDQPDRRAGEVATIRQALCRLGTRLDFKVLRRGELPEPLAPGPLPEFDVLWQDNGQPAYAFAIQWTARVHDLLLAEAPVGVQPCLVMPGGRAELVGFKLQRDPRLRQAVARAGWEFIKYRHLRRIVAEETLNRHMLKQIFGLDPIIERDGAQMPLF